MTAARPPIRARVRLPLWLETTSITAASLAAALVTWFAMFIVVPPGGCVALGAIIMFGFTLIFLMVWVVQVIIALVGAIFSFRGSRLGPYLTVVANLPVILLLSWWDPVLPGQEVWGWILVAFTALPVLAVALSGVQLILRGVSGHLVGAFAAMLVVGLLIPTMGRGWVLDLNNAYQTPPSVSTSPRTAC
jgi:hypothetical protein